MKLVKASGMLGLATLAAVASPFALADQRGGYVGANFGWSAATIDDERITSSLLARGFTTTSISDDDRDTGYKVFGGYQFNRNFALEGGYFNLGQFGYTATTEPPGTLTGNIKLQGVNLDLVGIVPFTEKFSAFARVGVIYAEAKDHFAGTGSVNVLDPNPSKRDTNYKFGVGLQYDFTESLAMRVEAERYRIDDAVGNKGDIDLASVGLVYRFGAGTAVAVAPAPPPVADCSAMDDDGDGVNNCNDKCPGSQAGQAIGPDGCPVPLTIDLKGVNFDFDESTLRPDGVAILDEAVSILGRYPELRVEVAGHTDSIGTEQYNQGLSERRARTVYDYLTGHGIDAGRMVGPNGYGETRPIAPNTNPDGSDNPEGRARNRRSELNVQN
ncbi:MAG TPA: outer membrane beta-barrel protein [Luteimonas sp.]|nr:outer membrane beta-barrel protein [Luteimonas sp.]